MNISLSVTDKDKTVDLEMDDPNEEQLFTALTSVFRFMGVEILSIRQQARIEEAYAKMMMVTHEESLEAKESVTVETAAEPILEWGKDKFRLNVSCPECKETYPWVIKRKGGIHSCRKCKTPLSVRPVEGTPYTFEAVSWREDNATKKQPINNLGEKLRSVVDEKH